MGRIYKNTVSVPELENDEVGVADKVTEAKYSRQDFNSVERTIDRDIREHEFNELDFDLNYTDSRCPLTDLVEAVREPGMDYHFARFDEKNIGNLMNKKWDIEDPSKLKNRINFSLKERDPAEREFLRTGDVVLMSRDSRYGEAEKRKLNQKNIEVVRSTMKAIDKTDVSSYLTPFRNPVFRDYN